MNKTPTGINRSLIIVALILVVPIIFLIYQNYSFKKQQVSEDQNKKRLNQEAYDQCVRSAFLTFRSDERDLCWRYEHDATGCDLSYYENLEIIKETPEDKLKSELNFCNSKYPADERLFSNTSPDAEILPFGEIGEREAFKKVMATDEYENFTSPPIEEGYRISYEVTSPTKDKPNWIFRLYKYSSSDEQTVATFKVNAVDGTLTKI